MRRAQVYSHGSLVLVYRLRTQATASMFDFALACIIILPPLFHLFLHLGLLQRAIPHHQHLDLHIFEGRGQRRSHCSLG